MICFADVIASRGERLELLVDKTEDLSNSVCVWLRNRKYLKLLFYLEENVPL